MITLTREEAQHVLDALEPIALYKAYNGDDWPARQVMPAIETLRARLSEKEPEPVMQFRKAHCADWYDGYPDPSDGGGPYETRVLYKSPQHTKGKNTEARPTGDDWFAVSTHGPANLRIEYDPDTKQPIKAEVIR